MFENLFTRGAILKRYRTAPLFDERLRYLMHCEQVGVRPKALRAIAAHQVNLVHLLDLREGDRVNMVLFFCLSRHECPRFSRRAG